MTPLQRLKRELSELRLAARIAAGFGLSENAQILAARADGIAEEIAQAERSQA